MSDERTLSRDARLLLAAIASHDHDDEGSIVPPAAGWVSEIPIRRLARQARLTVEAATTAAAEIHAAQRDGITVEGNNVILRH